MTGPVPYARRPSLSTGVRRLAVVLFPSVVAIDLLWLSVTGPVPWPVVMAALVAAVVAGLWLRRDPLQMQQFLAVTALFALYTGIEVMGRAPLAAFLHIFLPGPVVAAAGALLTVAALALCAAAAAGIAGAGGLPTEVARQALSRQDGRADRAPVPGRWSRAMTIAAAGAVLAVALAALLPVLRGPILLVIAGTVGVALLSAISAGRTIQLMRIVRQDRGDMDRPLHLPDL